MNARTPEHAPSFWGTRERQIKMGSLILGSAILCPSACASSAQFSQVQCWCLLPCLPLSSFLPDVKTSQKICASGCSQRFWTGFSDWAGIILSLLTNPKDRAWQSGGGGISPAPPRGSQSIALSPFPSVRVTCQLANAELLILLPKAS